MGERRGLTSQSWYEGGVKPGASSSTQKKKSLILNCEEKRKETGSPETRQKSGYKMQLTAVLWGSLLTLLLSQSPGKKKPV